MKYTKSFLFFLIVLLASCQSSKEFFTVGTTGAMYAINPFPSPEDWIQIFSQLDSGFEKNTNNSILWVTGSFKSNGIKFSFPGDDIIEDNIFYSDIDFNDEFFSYFDEKDISVYLQIEPGTVNVDECIRIVLDNYGNHKSIAGVCVDLEWLINNNDGYVYKETISSWLKLVSSYNSKNKLLLKHWNIKKIEPLIDKNIVYIQSMEGITSLDELKHRHQLWYRTFYPSPVGLEIGFSSGKEFWYEYDRPLYEISSIIDDSSILRSSVFLSESTVLDYINHLNILDK